MKIPEPESDVDSNDSNMMEKLYHLDKLGINDVKFEWFDLNKAVNYDGQNEITETKLEAKMEKDWADDVDSMALEILIDHVDQVDWCGANVVMMLETAGTMNCCGLIMDAK